MLTYLVLGGCTMAAGRLRYSRPPVSGYLKANWMVKTVSALINGRQVAKTWRQDMENMVRERRRRQRRDDILKTTRVV